MKRTAAILLIFALILTCVTALADSWYCPECGQRNESNFCSNCGTKRPESSGTSASSSTGGMNIDKAVANSDGSVTFTWSGGTSPYTLEYEWYGNDNHNIGTDIIRWTAVENIYGNNTMLKYDLVPGERYWIILRDSDNHTLWYDYHPKRETFTKIPGSYMVLSLRIMRNKRSSTVSSFTANEIEREYLSTLFGGTIKMNIGTRTSNLVCTARMAMFLPNGEPLLFHVEDCDIPGWMSAPGWETYDMKYVWTQLMSIKETIPAGRYTFRLYLDNGLFGQSDISIT